MPSLREKMAGKIRIKGGELHVAVLSLKFPLEQTI